MVMSGPQANLRRHWSPIKRPSPAYHLPSTLKLSSSSEVLAYNSLRIKKPKTPLCPGDTSSSPTDAMPSHCNPPQVRLSQLAGPMTPKVLDEADIDIGEEELEIDSLRSEVQDLHSKLGTQEHVNAILGRKLKECTDQLEEMLERTKEQQQALEEAQTSNQELRAELERLKSQQTEPRNKVSSEDLAALEAQFREAEDYQMQLISENAKLTGLFKQTDQAKRLVRVLKRLYQMNMEVSQILIICSSYEAGERLNLSSLHSMETSSTQVEPSIDVLQDCEGEVELLGRGLEKIKRRITEQLYQ